MRQSGAGFENIADDYYSHIYGGDYRKFVEYFERINAIFPYELISTNKEEGGMKKTIDVSAEQIERLDEIDEVLAIRKEHEQATK